MHPSEGTPRATKVSPDIPTFQASTPSRPRRPVRRPRASLRCKRKSKKPQRQHRRQQKSTALPRHSRRAVLSAHRRVQTLLHLRSQHNVESIQKSMRRILFCILFRYTAEIDTMGVRLATQLLHACSGGALCLWEYSHAISSPSDSRTDRVYTRVYSCILSVYCFFWSKSRVRTAVSNQWQRFMSSLEALGECLEDSKQHIYALAGVVASRYASVLTYYKQYIRVYKCIGLDRYPARCVYSCILLYTLVYSFVFVYVKTCTPL